MKKILLMGFLLAMFVLVGCTSQSQDNEVEQIKTPLEMKNESMMDKTSDKKGMMGEDSMMNDVEEMIVEAQKTILAGEDIDISTLTLAKSSTIVDVEDGETFRLSADIVMKEINGKQYKMYGYNRQIPGPVIRVTKDSSITVNFVNNMDFDTTVHWHGLRHDFKDDGVPDVTQAPVKPGESYTYTVYFPDEGIYWYHPHVREDLQQDLGLAGNMLVKPLSASYYNPVNKEEVLILDDILIEKGEIVGYGKEHANQVIMGRFGNIMLVNGETDLNINANKGEVIRFYLTNVANVRPYNVSFVGAKIKLVGGDLGKYEKEEYVESVTISPAERYIVEVLFDKPGTYTMQNINPLKSYDLATITVSNEEVNNDLSAEFDTLRVNNDIIDDIKQFEPYFKKEIDYTIELTLNRKMGMTMDQMEMDADDEDEIEWEDTMGKMNRMSNTEMIEWVLKDAETGDENMDIKMDTKVGDKVKIRIFNDPESIHPMQHPVHLHGQRFIVLTVDGEEVENKVWKDTVLVPIGSTVDILVDVTNPGEWMMHCHIAEHLEAGMMASFSVKEN